MALTLESKIIITMLMMLGTWASQAMSCSYHEASIAEKHEQWMAKYGRSYANEAEKEKRFQIFKDNLEFIDTFNNAGNQTYTLGLNKFADLTEEEFFASYTGYNNCTYSTSSTTLFRYEDVTEVPTSMDWREQGAVTSVKHQGPCGSCWAFSAVAAMEGIIQITTGELISLSEQQLLDCARNGCNEGCNGGHTDAAFEYIVQNQGLNTEANYPYEYSDGTCQANREAITAAQIVGYEDVPPNDEEALLKAVANQPISVNINIGALSFLFYSSGVFTRDCGNLEKHAGTIVGYGRSEDVKYWLIKNQWGESWGENGYMRIQRDVDAPEGLCGIAMKASYPVTT